MATRTIEISDLVTALDDRITELQISASRAAAELGVAPQSISQWRRGANIKLTPELQGRLAAFLQVPPRRVAELYGLDVSDDYPFPHQRKEVLSRRGSDRRKHLDVTPVRLADRRDHARRHVTPPVRTLTFA